MSAARAVVAIAFIFGVTASAAESPKVPRIGIFTFGVPYSGPLIAAFREGLKAEGYVEGRNIAFVFRSVDGQPERASAYHGSALVAWIQAEAGLRAHAGGRAGWSG